MCRCLCQCICGLAAVMLGVFLATGLILHNLDFVVKIQNMISKDTGLTAFVNRPLSATPYSSDAARRFLISVAHGIEEPSERRELISKAARIWSTLLLGCGNTDDVDEFGLTTMIVSAYETLVGSVEQMRDAVVSGRYDAVCVDHASHLKSFNSMLRKMEDALKSGRLQSSGVLDFIPAPDDLFTEVFALVHGSAPLRGSHPMSLVIAVTSCLGMLREDPTAEKFVDIFVHRLRKAIPEFTASFEATFKGHVGKCDIRSPMSNGYIPLALRHAEALGDIGRALSGSGVDKILCKTSTDNMEVVAEQITVAASLVADIMDHLPSGSRASVADWLSTFSGAILGHSKSPANVLVLQYAVAGMTWIPAAVLPLNGITAFFPEDFGMVAPSSLLLLADGMQQHVIEDDFSWLGKRFPVSAFKRLLVRATSGDYVTEVQAFLRSLQFPQGGAHSGYTDVRDEL